MRDPFPYMGYKKFLITVVVFLLLCGKNLLVMRSIISV